MFKKCSSYSLDKIELRKTPKKERRVNYQMVGVMSPYRVKSRNKTTHPIVGFLGTGRFIFCVTQFLVIFIYRLKIRFIILDKVETTFIKAVPLPIIFRLDLTSLNSSTSTHGICKTIGPDLFYFSTFIFA